MNDSGLYRRIARYLETRRGRRAFKLFVVVGGIVWCGSGPGLVGTPHARVPEAGAPAKVRAAIDSPVQLATLPPDEAAERVRELLSRRNPGDLERARALLDEALAAAPAERERRRTLSRLRAALRRLEREESRLAYAMKDDVDGHQKDLPGPLPAHYR